MLTIKNLHASVEGKKILQGVSLTVKPGEVHALMGPNGSGKSTLASVVMGHPAYRKTSGTISFHRKNIGSLGPDERGRLGLFLSFQYPVEVPGLSLEHFLRAAYNARFPQRQKSVTEFHAHLAEKMQLLGVREEFSRRSLNEGFSGGEKKRAEILQLAALQPTLAILDETDSGLDIDSLKAVCQAINTLRSPQVGFLVITHYIRILKYLRPDQVHVMREGQIIKSGRRELAQQIERRGYDWLATSANGKRT